MIGRCGDCKHFRPQPSLEDDFKTGWCGAVPDDPKDMKRDQMIVLGNDLSDIVVGEDFGCIHFDRKEAE